MSMVDVFSADAFTMVSLTNSIKVLPHVPSRIEQLGVFSTKGIPSTVAVIESVDGILELIQSAKRGAPAALGKAPKRKARSFPLIHLPLEDTILAESVMNVRAFGSETALQGVMEVVNDRLTTMKQNHVVTREHLAMGAIHGVILDADLSQISSLFTQFSVAETSIDFVLGTDATNIQGKCINVLEAIELVLGNAVYSSVHAFCGKTWFANFVDHPTVKAAYNRWRDGEALRSDLRSGFQFAGITFEVYTGKVSGVDFINANQVRFFPLGITDLFVHIYGPADFMETVNTIGQPLYAKQELMEFGRGVKIHTQSNIFPMCTRPGVLIKGTTSN